jgi:hypothetical protein
MAAGRAVADLARRLELGGLRVAVITGDDVLDRVDRVVWWGTGAPADGEWLGAHAYLGIEKMVTAVAEGAQVVVTGRVADSALFAAPLLATWADGAGRAGDDGLLAAALALGHLLECGGQLTGGNLAAWQGPELGPSDLADLGYPLATLRADGTAEVRVLPGKPARLDPLTCTLQLLYEVHDPAHYATPDAVMDLSAVEFAATPDGAVTVSGVRCRPRPADLKVVGFLRRPGVVADVEIGYAGIGALDRARQAADTVRHRLERLGLCEARVDIVGVDSILGGATATVAPPAEVRAHVSVRCPDDDVAQAVEDEVYALTLCGPAGGAALRSERRPHIEVRSGGIARGQVDQHVEWVS